MPQLQIPFTFINFTDADRITEVRPRAIPGPQKAEWAKYGSHAFLLYNRKGQRGESDVIFMRFFTLCSEVYAYNVRDWTGQRSSR